jgi:hypothetical protein
VYERTSFPKCFIPVMTTYLTWQFFNFEGSSKFFANCTSEQKFQEVCDKFFDFLKLSGHLFSWFLNG